MSDESSRADENLAHPWRALTICLVGGGMVLLDVSIVNVALPSIRTGLAASESALQWVLSGYALTFGLLLVPAGRIGDLRGRRTVFVVALGLFTLASALASSDLFIEEYPVMPAFFARSTRSALVLPSTSIPA